MAFCDKDHNRVVFANSVYDLPNVANPVLIFSCQLTSIVQPVNILNQACEKRSHRLFGDALRSRFST